MIRIGMARDRQSAPWFRLGLFVGMTGAEMLIISLLFVLDRRLFGIEFIQYVIRQLVLLCAAAGAAFTVISWPKRHELLEIWQDPTVAATWRLPVAVNLALFAVLAIATVAFSRHVAAIDRPPWALYGGYLTLLAATGLSLLWVAAPAKVWLSVLGRYPAAIALSALAGSVALISARLAQSVWVEMSGATLRLSYAILSLYETNVRVDYGIQVLGVRNFAVHIDASCSGYEGIGLVVVFLSLYLWVFRSTLRFPNALLLLPIGIVTIWLLNAVRIAALTSIGAHVSPEVAIGGFHSQAGWIAFLLVAIGIMALAPRFSFFAGRASVTEARSPSDRLMLAYLAPFMGLMVAGIAMAASAPYDAWLYPLKVVAVGACLWLFRDVYRGLVAPIDPVALMVGIVVGVVWIATAPASGASNAVGAWIATQPFALVVLWLGIRSLGAIVMVPIAEELAFRGLLHRWLISRRFETVEFATFSWLAFIVSSLLFGLMHQRMVAGALAGAVFALLMYRSGRLSDPIAAHVTANAVIVAWALAARDWTLL